MEVGYTGSQSYRRSQIYSETFSISFNLKYLISANINVKDLLVFDHLCTNVEFI